MDYYSFQKDSDTHLEDKLGLRTQICSGLKTLTNTESQIDIALFTPIRIGQNNSQMASLSTGTSSPTHIMPSMSISMSAKKFLHCEGRKCHDAMRLVTIPRVHFPAVRNYMRSTAKMVFFFVRAYIYSHTASWSFARRKRGYRALPRCRRRSSCHFGDRRNSNCPLYIHFNSALDVFQFRKQMWRV